MSTPRGEDEPAEFVGFIQSSGTPAHLYLNDTATRLKIVHDNVAFSMDSPPAEDHVLQLEDGRIATLLRCQTTNQNWTANLSIVTRTLRPHLTIIGESPWPLDQKVSVITFTFFGAKAAFDYTEHRQQSFVASDDGRVNIDRVDFSKLEAFRVESGPITLIAHFDISQTGGQIDFTTTTMPRVTLEFAEPVEIAEAMQRAYHAQAFFAFSTGHRTRPLEVRVNYQSRSERHQLREAKRSDIIEDFELRAHYRSFAGESEPDRFGSVFSMRTSAHRDEICKALKAWLDRRIDWGNAYHQMSECLALTGTLNRNRILNLASWFEEIPTSRRESGVSKATIAALAAAAHERALHLGEDISLDRLQGKLDGLSELSFSRRLQACAQTLRDAYGEYALPSSISADLKRFSDLRHSAAHGALRLARDQYHATLRAVAAMELVCFLLQLRDLLPSPIPSSVLTAHSLTQYHRSSQWREDN